MRDFVVDARGLSPPGPFERAMEALDQIDSGVADRVRLLVDRQPLPLFQVLAMNGYRQTSERLPDGSWEVLITAGH